PGDSKQHNPSLPRPETLRPNTSTPPTPITNYRTHRWKRRDGLVLTLSSTLTQTISKHPARPTMTRGNAKRATQLVKELPHSCARNVRTTDWTLRLGSARNASVRPKRRLSSFSEYSMPTLESTRTTSASSSQGIAAITYTCTLKFSDFS